MMEDRLSQLEKENRELRRRLDNLADEVHTNSMILSHFVELVYEPEFVKKLDKLARHGQK